MNNPISYQSDSLIGIEFIELTKLRYLVNTKFLQV